MFKKLKDKKGFTLVELIVVLVILAILAALLVPALTGYIDKARKEAVVAETRSAVMAAQTIVSEKYGTAKGDVTVATTDYTDIKNLAEVPGTITDIVVDQVTGSDNKGAVTKLTILARMASILAITTTRPTTGRRRLKQRYSSIFPPPPVVGFFIPSTL